MPIIPVTPVTAPYDTLNNVLNTARVRMNDAIASLGGDILTNEQPFTQQMANTAWRKLQSFLANLGYSRMRREVIIPGLPVVASSDPASRTFLNWTSYWDGQAFWLPPQITPFPLDMIMPLKIWERPTGIRSEFKLMEMVLDGLPDGFKGPFNNYWSWQEDTCYMPGSLRSMDLRVLYAAYLTDFATVGQTLWYNQPVPIMRSLSALANYICAEAAGPRGDMDAGTFVTAAEQDARLMFNVEVGAKQRTTATRRPYGRRSNYGYR